MLKFQILAKVEDITRNLSLEHYEKDVSNSQPNPNSIQLFVDGLTSLHLREFDNILEFLSKVSSIDCQLNILFNIITEVDEVGNYWIVEVFLEGRYTGLNFEIDNNLIIALS